MPATVFLGGGGAFEASAYTPAFETGLSMCARVATDLLIEDILDEAPNTARFTVGGERPPGGAPFVLEVSTDDLAEGAFDGPAFDDAGFAMGGAADLRLFAGSLQRIEEILEGRETQLAWAVDAIDQTMLLNRRRPFGTWTNVSWSLIVVEVLGDFAPEFTTNYVQTNLPPITISCDGSEDFSTFLSRGNSMVGGCHWYVDHSTPPGLHLFYSVPPVTDYGPTGIAGPTTALTVAETANNITGGSGTIAYYAPFRVRYVYADGRVSRLGPMSNVLRVTFGTPAKTVLFTGIPIGPDVDGVPVIARQIYSDAGGDVYSRWWYPYFQVADNTTTSWEFDEGIVSPALPIGRSGQYGPGLPLWPIAYAADTPPIAPRPSGPIAFTATVSGTDTPDGAADQQIENRDWIFAMTNVFADDTESVLGAVSNTVQQVIGNTKLVTFSGLPLGASVGGVPVVYRKIFAASAPTGGAAPTFAFVAGVGYPNVVQGWELVPNNTATTSDGTERYFPTGGNGFLNPWFPSATWVIGPDLEGGADPEPLDALNTSILWDSPLHSTMDWSQIRTRVFVQGAGSTLSTAEAAGTAALSVSDVSMFAGQAGQILVGTRVLDFTGTSGSTVVLAAVLPAPGLPIGTPVSLWIERNDYEAQADLALDEGGDGIHDFTIVDSSLVTLETMAARADAELLLFSRPILTVIYATRDPKTKAGKTIVIDLADPPIDATLKIQAVTIDQVVISKTLQPRYTATASSVRFTLEDLLRRIP